MISKDKSNEGKDITEPVLKLKYLFTNKEDWQFYGEKGEHLVDVTHNDRCTQLSVEVVEIMHSLVNMRQEFLQSNLVEEFHNKIFTPIYKSKDIEANISTFESAMKSMCKSSDKFLPLSKNFKEITKEDRMDGLKILFQDCFFKKYSK